MKRSSDNQTSMYSSNGNSQTMDYNNKKLKMEVNVNKPSRVVHLRGVPNDVSDVEIVQLALSFGRISNLVVSKKKNQALVEMMDIAAAQAMVQYYGEHPPSIRKRVVHVQFSTYEKLKTENTRFQDDMSNLTDQLVLGMDENRTVLRVIIDNMLYPVTVDILKLIFSKYGQVLRIVTYNKNNSFQALIEYADGISAKSGLTALNGQNIYNGCCTLRIDYSHLETLQVKYNNEKTYDYTDPNLPSGPMASVGEQMGILDTPHGDGILGSYSGNFGGLGGSLGGIGGNFSNISKLGAMPAGLTGFSAGGLGNFGGGGLGGIGGLAGLGSMLGGVGAGLAGAGGMMMGGNNQSTGHSVLIISNLNEEKVNTDYLFTLFGMYGMVTRVKIMYNKKDTALVQFSDPALALNAVNCLDKLKWYGKVMKVSVSKHNYIQMPKEGQADEGLTKDYTNSKLHRHANPGSKKYGAINPPSAVLHITNIPQSMTEDELRDLFGKCGHVVGFRFLENEKKMALLKMETIEDAVAALVELHNYQLPGPQYLRVSFTKSNL
ncbi:hypothetical protein HELRODRAFT_94426 [Helobdella robusta]|uniref:RRM domain-containing protein n=1 Tax=Helobdella robusta TaxID=6412 RepID=T1G912_HELRO|nr:hypothetical protein HELRODRAFT_94426 [Helobdella robusta]ESO02174.1 hypothetical protein HELRODRAFT_94426 [Helobdella robusta]